MKRIAFADEYGNNSFEFETQGTHFIVATVICKADNVSELEKQVDKIRKVHNFQTGELKSSKVGKNHYRRKKILEDIVNLDISIYAVIVDKRKLNGKGFHYKKSFYKYLNNLLYKELFRTFTQLELYVDEYGGNDYMLEFKKYVAKHHQRTLFSGSDFEILNSKESNLIQVADFVAGTLGYIYDERKKSDESDNFLNILKPKISNLNFFPKEYSYEEIAQSNTDNSFDPIIAELSILRITDFLDKVNGKDQQTIDQINFLKLLLLYQRVYYKSKYISTKEIFNHLNQLRTKNLHQEYFRAKVVGNLRDKGILIASSRNGYKIPVNRKDIEAFIKHGNKIIIPMLNRIQEVRNAVKMATDNKLDLLENFDELKQMIENNDTPT